MKKLLKPMVIAAAATMAFSATAFAGTSSPYSLNINGKAANGEVLVLVPLRETAEQLGFKVSYNKGTILVDDGIMHTNLTIGENSFQVVTSNPDLVGMSAPFSLSSAPVMTNGKTYVPIELFVPLTGNDSSIIKTDGSAISISKKADTKNEDVQIPNPLTEHETLADLAKTVGFDVTLPIRKPLSSTSAAQSQMYALQTTRIPSPSVRQKALMISAVTTKHIRKTKPLP